MRQPLRVKVLQRFGP